MVKRTLSFLFILLLILSGAYVSALVVGIPVEVYAPPSEGAAPPAGGTLTWSDNFNSGSGRIGSEGDWDLLEGSMTYDSNQIHKEGDNAPHYAVVKQYAMDFTDGYIEVDYNCEGSNYSRGGIFWRMQDLDNMYWLRLYPNGNPDIYIQRDWSGGNAGLGSDAKTISNSTTYTIGLTISGGDFELYIDGVKELSVTDNTFTSGWFGIMQYRSSSSDSQWHDNFSCVMDYNDNPTDTPYGYIGIPNLALSGIGAETEPRCYLSTHDVTQSGWIRYIYMEGNDQTIAAGSTKFAIYGGDSNFGSYTKYTLIEGTGNPTIVSGNIYRAALDSPVYIYDGTEYGIAMATTDTSFNRPETTGGTAMTKHDTSAFAGTLETNIDATSNDDGFRSLPMWASYEDDYY